MQGHWKDVWRKHSCSSKRQDSPYLLPLHSPLPFRLPSMLLSCFAPPSLAIFSRIPPSLAPIPREDSPCLNFCPPPRRITFSSPCKSALHHLLLPTNCSFPPSRDSSPFIFGKIHRPLPEGQFLEAAAASLAAGRNGKAAPKTGLCFQSAAGGSRPQHGKEERRQSSCPSFRNTWHSSTSCTTGSAFQRSIMIRGHQGAGQ